MCVVCNEGVLLSLQHIKHLWAVTNKLAAFILFCLFIFVLLPNETVHCFVDSMSFCFMMLLQVECMNIMDLHYITLNIVKPAQSRHSLDRQVISI